MMMLTRATIAIRKWRRKCFIYDSYNLIPDVLTQQPYKED